MSGLGGRRIAQGITADLRDYRLELVPVLVDSLLGATVQAGGKPVVNCLRDGRPVREQGRTAIFGQQRRRPREFARAIPEW